jgi:hypothetical protein
MKPNERFLNLPKHFWANVRLISQQVGYTDRKGIKIPAFSDMQTGLQKVGLTSNHIIQDQPTE